MSVFNFLKNLLLPKNNKDDFSSSEPEPIVFDCIIPTKDINLCHIQTSFKEILQIFDKDKNNFLLVYDNNSDDLVGIITEKDIINTLWLKEKKDGCDFLFSNLFYVPYIMNINEAIRYMYKKNTNLLVVVDNRGITLGILTKASIIDFIYGYEIVKEFFKKNVKNYSIEVDGTLLLKHIPEDWYIEEFSSCYKSGTRTIGGFLCYYTGTVLENNKEITIGKITFLVIKSDKKVIKKILLKKNI